MRLTFIEQLCLIWCMLVGFLSFCQAQVTDSFSTTVLTSGPYKVGYRSSLYYDEGREPLTDQVEPNKHGRVVYMSVWYPASVKANNKPIRFEHYVLELAKQVNPVSNPEEAKRMAKADVLFRLSQLHGDTLVMKSNLDALLKSHTKAFVNATPIKQQFPVIYYPDYPHLNSIMAEALASYGFIVVSPSRHGTRNSDFEWQQVRGMETRIQDYQFLLPRVKAMFQLKEPSVALMGIGMSVSDGLLWMMRNKSVKTLVSMEGGILTQFEYDMMKNSPYYNLESLTNPILVFYTPHRDINPALVNGFKHTERHIFYLPQMTEFYFLNYGAWQSIMPGILGKAPGDTRRSYKYAFAYILSFLSWQLKADSGAETDFRETPQQKQYDTALIQYSFKEKMEIPPSATDLENRWVKSGIDEVIRFLEPKLKDDPEFISNTSFSYLGAQLINHHRAFNDCIKWCQLFARQYPNASSAQSMQGRSYLELNQPEKAKIAYEKALELLNDDPYLTLPQRQGLKNALKQRLSNFSTR